MERRFFKQYGERRTGTNVLRALVVRNFEDVTVLIHVLGDKHSAPTDIDDIQKELAGTTDAAWDFIRRATFAVPARTTKPEDERQLACLWSLAVPVESAVREGRLGCLISVKDPHAWSVSLMRWRRWLPLAPATEEREREVCERLRRACLESNEKHRGWLALHERWGARSSIVRFEDLIESPHDVLAALERRHQLRRRRPAFDLVTDVVEPTPWDDDQTPSSGTPFDADRYRLKRYLQELTPSLLEVVAGSIDWELFGRFGYRRQP